MTVTADEFLRRFILHVLPHGFVRIRFFGFLANRRRKTLLPLCQQLLRMPVPSCPNAALPKANSAALWRCSRCGGSMLLVQSFTITELNDYRLKPVGSGATESRGGRLKPSQVLPAQSRLKARWARLS
jgi:hypothetical protein